MGQALKIAFAGVVSCCWASAASAEPSPHDPATAQALFEDGKQLMDAGKLDEACPKLVESQRLDPGGGTLLAIALCHEKQGKTATAWAEFNVAATEARKDKRTDRETAAVDHVKALEARLTRLRLTVPPQVRAPGIEVTRDGVHVGEPQWGTALPVDPGEHVIEANAPGKVAYRGAFEVRGEGRTIDVVLPSLQDAPAQAAAKPVGMPPLERESSSSDARSNRLILAGIIGGVGLVATGVGAGFGLSAGSKWDDAERASNVELGKDAGTAADISTVAFTVGAIGIVTGVVLWLTAPEAPKSASGGRFTAKGFTW